MLHLKVRQFDLCKWYAMHSQEILFHNEIAGLMNEPTSCEQCIGSIGEISEAYVGKQKTVKETIAKINKIFNNVIE